MTATTDLTLHGQVADRLRQQDQRYNASRRELVGLLQDVCTGLQEDWRSRPVS